MRSSPGFVAQAFRALKKPVIALMALSLAKEALQETKAEAIIAGPQPLGSSHVPTYVPEITSPYFSDPIPSRPVFSIDPHHTSLGNAISRDDVAEVSSLLEKDARILNVLTGPYKVHPWLFAIAEGKLNTVKFLYENRVKYNLNVFMVGSQKFPNSSFTIKDSTALGHACIFGRLQIIKFLYDNGFFSREVNGLNEAATCIVNAIAANSGEKIIPQLRNWGVDVNATMAFPTHTMMGKKPQPPMIYDPLQGLQILLTQGLNPHLTWANQTLLEKALSIADAESIDLLLKYNADMKNATVEKVQQAVETTQASLTFFRSRSYHCGKIPMRLCKPVFESDENRKLKNNLIALGKLFNYGIDYTQCNALGQDIIFQIARMIKEKLPYRDQPTKDNGFSQFVYNEYIKAFFAPALLDKILKRLEANEEIESETRVCQIQSQLTHQRNSRENAEFIQKFLLSLGGLVFSLAALHFRENIINLPKRIIEYSRRPAIQPSAVEVVEAKIAKLEEEKRQKVSPKKLKKQKRKKDKSLVVISPSIPAITSPDLASTLPVPAIAFPELASASPVTAITAPDRASNSLVPAIVLPDLATASLVPTTEKPSPKASISLQQPPEPGLLLKADPTAQDRTDEDKNMHYNTLDSKHAEPKVLGPAGKHPAKPLSVGAVAPMLSRTQQGFFQPSFPSELLMANVTGIENFSLYTDTDDNPFNPFQKKLP